MIFFSHSKFLIKFKKKILLGHIQNLKKQENSMMDKKN